MILRRGKRLFFAFKWPFGPTFQGAISAVSQTCELSVRKKLRDFYDLGTSGNLGMGFHDEKIHPFPR